MDDDKIRKACARALGFDHRENPERPGRYLWFAQDWRPQWFDSGPPLDGNTAMSLLDRLPPWCRVVIVGQRIELHMLFEERWSKRWRTAWADAQGASRSIILAALLALGEISEEDANGG